MKRTQSNRDGKHEMEMTPMIDVTFLLLIFFMCTLKFKTLEGKLAAYLPKDAGMHRLACEPPEDVEVSIAVAEEGRRLRPDGSEYAGSGRFVFDSTRRLTYSVGTLRTSDSGALADRLVELHRRDPERGMKIEARTGVLYSEVVQVLDDALAAQFADVTFVGSGAP